MSPDPNWLLSTIVQSAAAFIAILAGFIVSRLISLSAERNGIEIKIKDAKTQLAIKAKNLEEFHLAHLEWDAWEFIETKAVIRELLKNRGEISLSNAMNLSPDSQRTEKELLPYWEFATQTIKEAFRLLIENLERLPEETVDFGKFLKEIKQGDTAGHEFDLFFRVYIYLLTAVEKSTTRSPFNMYIPTMSSWQMPEVVPVAEANRYSDLLKDIQTLEQEKNALNIQLTDFRAQLKNIGVPQGLYSGVIILVYFACVGIVYPVLLMPLSSEEFTPFLKWSVSLLFFSGLLLFFVYLLFSIKQLMSVTDLDST